MKYTIFLTEDVNGNIQATATTLPDCTVAASTKTEALKLIREKIESFVARNEIVQIEVPAPPLQWMGVFKDDPTWDEIFDDIERKRDHRW